MEMTGPGDGTAGVRPLVSVIMANFRGAAFLPSALESVLRQTVSTLEVIVSDDASPDESVEVVRRFMADDPRVKLVVAEGNGGPAAARNRALNLAQGEWIAIIDSDDVVHPERLEILIAAAEQLDADGIADDLLFFSDAGRGSTLLGHTAALGAQEMTPGYFVRSNTTGSGLPPLGYLKPVFRRSRLAGLRYDEAVRIAEDYDFLLRFLLAGHRFFVLPEPLYLYRRHSQSISHRLSEETVAAMIGNQEALEANLGPFPSEVETPLRERMTALRTALAFEQLVVSLKHRRFGHAMKLLCSKPELIVPLARSASESLQSRIRKPAAADGGPVALILHGEDEAPSAAGPIRSALGLAPEAVPIRVPAYASRAGHGGTASQSRALWVHLAETAMRSEAEITCYGLSGLYAAGFLPKQRLAAVVVQDESELARVLELLAASPANLVVAERAMSAGFFAINTEELCPGYLLARPHAARTQEPDRRTAAQA